MHQPIDPKDDSLVPRFYKLMTGEDIVAYELLEDEESYELQRPLAIHIDNNVILGKAFLHVREWIPPIATKGDTLILSKKLVMLTMECNDEFKEEFKELADYFYAVQPLQMEETKKKLKEADKKKKDRKVVPFLVRDDSGEVH
jgi:hypothetical protein